MAAYSVSQYFTELGKFPSGEKSVRVTGFAYDIMLDSTKFVASVAVNGNWAAAKAYLDPLDKALMQLHRFNASVSLASPSNSLPSISNSLRDFAWSIVSLGDVIDTLPNCSHFPESKAGIAGPTLLMLGLGMARIAETEYSWSDGVANAVLSRKTTLQFLDELVNALVAVSWTNFKGDSQDYMRKIGSILNRGITK